MTKSRVPACVVCGERHLSAANLTPRETVMLFTADGVQLYCPACGPRHHATWEEKRYLRQLRSPLVSAVDRCVGRIIERYRTELD